MRRRLGRAKQLEPFRQGRVKEARRVPRGLMHVIPEEDLNRRGMVREVVRHQLRDLPDLSEM